MQVDGAIDRSKTPRAFKDFPPVPAMTLRQISHERFLFGYISSAHYGTLDFSPASKAIYGEPATYSDFRRLMTAPHNRKVLPKILDFDRLIATSSRFLWFCKLVDDRAAKKNAASVTRREMEAAWACLAVKLWETYMPVSGYKDTELLRKALDAVRIFLLWLSALLIGIVASASEKQGRAVLDAEGRAFGLGFGCSGAHGS